MLVNVIAPARHTYHRHNVFNSFYFAFALSALEVCRLLTWIQEGQLLEAYAFQLVEADTWEWAIYVLLFTFGDVDLIDKGMILQRKSMAQDIDLRHNNTNDYDVDLLSGHEQQQWQQKKQQRRLFLEQEVGVPSLWFEMALSHRHRRTFNPQGFLQQTASRRVVDL